MKRDWNGVHEQGMRLFNGEVPRGELEQDLIDFFEREPEIVLFEIKRMAARFAAGKVHTPWVLVLANVHDAVAGSSRNPTVDVGNERELLIRRAEQWISNAGHAIDRSQEIEDELFGPRGMLREWADDIDLRQEMFDKWMQVRQLIGYGRYAVETHYQTELRAQRDRRAQQIIDKARAEGKPKKEIESLLFKELRFSRAAVAKLMKEPVPTDTFPMSVDEAVEGIPDPDDIDF